MNEKLLQQIKQLPPLPESAMQIEAVYQNPDSTFNDMVKILEKDPLLTADILKAANSPLYGFSKEINAISQAVGLFGMGTVRGFALASIVKKSFSLDLSSYNISNAQYAELSKKQHALVTSWYIRKDPKLLGILSPAAFLVEIGKVLISQYLIQEKMQEEFQNTLAELQDVEAAEVKVIGVHAPEVSATVFTHWKFEEKLIETIRYCVNPENAPETIKKAAQSLHVARTAVPISGVMTETSIAAAKALVDQYGLDMDSFDKAIENVLS
jgi:HD-like signal output (HDOD) protein